MLDTSTARTVIEEVACPSPETRSELPDGAPAQGDSLAESLGRIKSVLGPTRRLVRAGDVLYDRGRPFCELHVINAGILKIVSPSWDGRQSTIGLKFRGDWLGFDGIATGVHACSAVAMDVGEVWTVAYDALLDGCAKDRALMAALHAAIAGETNRERESLMAVRTLPADARVAEFLRYWSESLSSRGLRTDEIALRMTRAEIGNLLGMTLESVSRALSRMARDKVIQFSSRGRRDVRIPDVKALSAFMLRCIDEQRPIA